MGQPDKCAHCRRHFCLNTRIENQSYCGRKECQRARKSKWQREKMASDPAHRINQQDSQKNWCKQNPDYWRKYRSRNKSWKPAFGLVLIGILHSFMVFGVIMPAPSPTGHHLILEDRYSWLGHSMGEILGRLFTDPFSIIKKEY